MEIPIPNANADTEWNDILRSHGILPPKPPPSPTKEIEEILIEVAENKKNDPSNMTEEELDEIDPEIFEAFRRQRIAEMEALRKRSIHGRVYPIQKPEWEREVTGASKDGNFVFVLLRSDNGGNVESRLLTALWRQLADKYGELKFCEITASLAIEGYPERNCPTVLVYKDEEVVKQLVTLREVGGVTTKLQDLEQFLVRLNAIQPSDQRLQDREAEDEDGASRKRGIIRMGGKTTTTEEEDDDWD